MLGVVDELQEVDDADPRVIAQLEAVDFSIEFIRDDVKPEYSDSDLDEAYQTIMGHQVAGDDFKDLIGEEFAAQTLFFENIIVFLFPSDRYQGVFASFDRHDEFPIVELVETATEIID